MRACISRTVGRFAVLAMVIAGEAALACTVCGQGLEQSRSAYITMTVIMSALPLSMAAGLAIWAVVRSRRQHRESLQAPLTNPDLRTPS